MKKITYVITKPIIGGAQVWLKDQVELLVGEYEISVVTSSRGWLTDNLSPDVKLYFVPSIEKRFSFRALFFLIRILSQTIKPDVVISSSANAGLYSRLVKVFYKHRSIYVSHGWSCIYNGGFLSKKVFIFVEKILSQLTDCIWCVSKEDSRKAIEVIGCSPSKVYILRNSVFPKKLNVLDTSSPLKLLFVGRLEQPKRPELLIEAVKGFPSIELTIVGDGKLRKGLVSYPNVNFLGEISGFNEFYRYDAFVLVSDSEGLPVSALEAASSGLPLILSDVGGCSELVRSMQPNGLLSSNDLESLTKALSKLITCYQSFHDSAQSEVDNFSLLNDKPHIINLIEGD